MSVNQDKATFVMIAAVTIILMYLINVFLSLSSSSGPLQRKILDMEQQLAGKMKELVQLQTEIEANKSANVDINENNPELRENQAKINVLNTNIKVHKICQIKALCICITEYSGMENFS